MKNTFALTLTLISSFAFADAQLILTPSSNVSKGASAVSMDIVSSSAWKGFQFDIDVTGAAAVDLSACATGLPKTLTISCKQLGDKVRVFAVDINGIGTDVKSGRIAIGQIKFSGNPSLEVSKLEFADKSGEVIQSSSVTAK